MHGHSKRRKHICGLVRNLWPDGDDDADKFHHAKLGLHGDSDFQFDADKCPGNNPRYRQTTGNICNSVKSNRQAGVVNLSKKG